MSWGGNAFTSPCLSFLGLEDAQPLHAVGRQNARSFRDAGREKTGTKRTTPSARRGELPTCDAATFTGDAGSWPITCSGGSDDNYQFSYVAGTLTVAQKPVTISFTAANKVYTATTAATITGCSVAVIETGDVTTCFR